MDQAFTAAATPGGTRDRP